MNRKPIQLQRQVIPEQFHHFLSDADVYDSSCSPEARVYFIDKESGFFLKSAPKGSLKTEAAMTAFFHDHQMGTEVIAYLEDGQDWLLTRRVPGEDCLDIHYLSQPERLADTLAELLYHLHSIHPANCPVQNRTADYLEAARRSYETRNPPVDLSLDSWGYGSVEEAWKMIEENGHLLKNDTLIHGDYCLPNVMLENWQFRGFIDVGNGGMGDRHVDLFWGAWSLRYNLKSNAYATRFLDAYGRENFDSELLRLVAAFEVFG